MKKKLKKLIEESTVRVKGPVLFSGKLKRAEKTAAALEAQAAAVESADFVTSPIPDWLRAAYAYERTAAPRTSDSRFRIGDICRIERQRAVCVRVSDCCACFVALSNRTIRFDTVAGDTVAFTANTENLLKVSANAELQIEQRLGADWRSKLFGQQPEQPKETMKDTSEADKPATKKGKGGKSAASKSKSETTATGYTSLKGRSERVKELTRSGKFKSFADLLAQIKQEYPGSSPGKVEKIYRATLAEMKSKS